MGSLPSPSMFQQVPAQMGPQPPPRYQAPGTLPYRQNPMAQVAQGLDAFMEAYTTQRQAREQEYGGKVQNVLSQISQGLIDPDHLDTKKVQRWMNLAGMPVRTEAPTPQEQQYNAQQKQAQQMQQQGQAMQGQGLFRQAGAASGGAAGPLPSALQNMLMAGAQGGVQQEQQGQQLAQQGANLANQPAPPPPKVGLMSRLFPGMRPTSDQSPMANYLRSLAAAGQVGGAYTPGAVAGQGQLANLERNMKAAGYNLGTMSAQQQQQLVQIAKAASQGNVDAIMMGSRFGLLKNLPADELASTFKMVNPQMNPTQLNSAVGNTLLWEQLGRPLMQYKMGLAKDLMPNFMGTGGDPMRNAMEYVNGLFTGQDTGTVPGMTPQQVEQMNTGMRPLMEAHPTAPAGLIQAYGYAQMSGNAQLTGALSKVISQFPRGKTIDQANWEKNFGLDTSRYNLDQQVRIGQLSVDTMRAIGEAGDAEAKQAYETLNDKNADPVAKVAALQRLASVDLKQSQVKLRIGTNADGSAQYYQLRDPVTVQGALHWYQQHYLSNVPPYLSRAGGANAQQLGQTPEEPLEQQLGRRGYGKMSEWDALMQRAAQGGKGAMPAIENLPPVSKEGENEEPSE